MTELSDQFDRLPPSSVESEQCVIASILLDPLVHRQVRRILKPEHFYQADNAIIYRICGELLNAGRALDGVILREALVKRQLFEEVGGLSYLAQILNRVPSSAHGVHYASIVVEKWRLREAIRIGNGLVRDAYAAQAEDDSSQKILNRAATAALKSSHDGLDIKITTLAEATAKFIESREAGESPAIPTHVEQFDREFMGIMSKRGHTVIAARPSMGKSLCMKWIAARQAAKGIRVGICSFEESEGKIAGNFISSYSGIQNKKVAYSRLDADDWRAIMGCAEELSGLDILIADQLETMSELMLTMEIMVEKHHRDIIYIDHLHLIGGLTGENQERRISTASKALKDAAKRLDIGTVTLAQLSRPEEKKGDPGPPDMRDLRASGAIEENADGIILLHRADYYHRFDPKYEADGICQFIFSKHRNGAIGDVLLRADLDHQRYEEIVEAPPHYIQPGARLF